MTCIGALITAAETITRVGKRDFMVNLLHAFWSFEAGASWRLLFVVFIRCAGSARVGAKKNLSAIGEGDIPRASTRSLLGIDSDFVWKKAQSWFGDGGQWEA